MANNRSLIIKIPFGAIRYSIKMKRLVPKYPPENSLSTKIKTSRTFGQLFLAKSVVQYDQTNDEKECQKTKDRQLIKLFGDLLQR